MREHWVECMRCKGTGRSNIHDGECIHCEGVGGLCREIWTTEDRQKHMHRIGTRYAAANAVRSGEGTRGFLSVSLLPATKLEKYKQEIAALAK